MIIVLLVIFVLLLIAGIICVANDLEYVAATLITVSIVGLLVCTIVLIVLCVNVSQLKVIDQKIEMYQEENAKIEEQISDVVKQYQEYESGIFAEVAPESAVTLVALYPELKTDTLVQKQVEVYLENNSKIKQMKETKINGSVNRWWLYFGGETE